MGNGYPWKSKYGGRSTTGKRKKWKNFGLKGWGDKDLAGWIRYHYSSCDVKKGGGFPYSITIGERKRVATSLSNVFILYKGTRTEKGDTEPGNRHKEALPFPSLPFLCNGLLAAFLLTRKSALMSLERYGEIMGNIFLSLRPGKYIFFSDWF